MALSLGFASVEFAYKTMVLIRGFVGVQYLASHLNFCQCLICLQNQGCQPWFCGCSKPGLSPEVLPALIYYHYHGSHPLFCRQTKPGLSTQVAQSE